jgi:hypothetical protein
MERNAEQKKPDLKTPESGLPFFLVLPLAQPPWGWKEASNEDGWGFGASRPGFSRFRRSGGVGVKDACELAR